MGYANAQINYTAVYRTPSPNNYSGNAGSASVNASYAIKPFYIPTIKYNNTAFMAYSV